MSDKEKWLDTPEPLSPRLSIALVDNHSFSQDCLVNAFSNKLILEARCFQSPGELFEDPTRVGDVDVIVVHLHSGTIEDARLIEHVARIVEAYTSIPLVIMSDAHNAIEALPVRELLKRGARGVIATRTTSLSLVVAALLFVKAGGTFAPVDIHAGDAPAPPTPVLSANPDNKFTARQLAVLDHMARGDANKIIAHELKMSESTVKVHVRNIMVKLRATNRTQAVYIYKTLVTNLKETPEPV